MYENKKEPLITRKHFKQRLILHVLLALLLVGAMLLVGTLGHIYFDDMTTGQALLASITLSSGLGLSILPSSAGGQIFAGVYGLLSGYLYIATCTIVIAPILHRLFHKFHLDEC